MANKKKGSTRSKSSAKSNKTGKPSAADRAINGKQPRPVRREVGAVVCLALAVVVLCGLLGLDKPIVQVFVNVPRGILGGGVFVLPLILVLDFFILMFHDGRPVRLRFACTWITVVCIGVFVHLLWQESNIPWEFSMVKELYQTGVAGNSGGILAGFIAMLLDFVMGKFLASLLLLVVLIPSLLYGFNMTVISLIKAIRARPRREYAPPVREHPDAAERLVNHVAQKQIERAERKQARISDFDLPVDDPDAERPEPAPETKKPASKRNKKDAFIESVAKMADKPVPEQEEPELIMPPLVLQEEKQDDFAAAFQEETPLVVKRKAEPEEELPVEPLEDPSKKVKKEEALMEAAIIASQIENEAPQQKVYAYPPESLLRSGSGSTVDGTQEMQLNAERLNDTLASFGIDAHIINVIRGPSVTRYELELDRGVKLSKITNLADDIALSLGATGVRISAIPDKISVVGIEVPNKLVSTVCIHDVIDSPEFQKSKSRISFAVGKDISGRCIIGDIAKLPHMLIAGTTGSGKSVCMNSLIISLLYKSKPEEVRMIMVDPKMVELGIYNGIPHLLIPVVTDPKKAAGALQWAVTEMMRRYRLMADANVRDLDSYNKVCGQDNMEPLPQIVVVIDELADLMLVAAKEVEEAICRVAQMGRASGIHLVIATQRPSADVITGLMKANIPSRIAFAVASAMESRIILDTAGAEKLVGKGDMLYAPLGQGKPQRVQGCFITDDEVQSVVDYIKKNATASYDDEVMDQINQKAAESGKSDRGGAANVAAEAVSDGDELLPAAVDVILETGQASVSMLQRRLKLGYARAARIVDEMEEKGIVGPFEGSKPRQLLITKEQWLQMQGLAPMEDENPPVEEEIP